MVQKWPKRAGHIVSLIAVIGATACLADKISCLCSSPHSVNVPSRDTSFLFLDTREYISSKHGGLVLTVKPKPTQDNKTLQLIEAESGGDFSKPARAGMADLQPGALPTLKHSKAVRDRRLRPRCCRLWSYSKHTSFSCRYIRRDIMCKNDVMNIQHAHCGLVGPDSGARECESIGPQRVFLRAVYSQVQGGRLHKYNL